MSKKAFIYAGISVVLWGSVVAIGKLLLKNISNYQLMFYVALFSTISLLIFLLINKQFISTLKVFKENPFFILGLGLIGLGIQQYLYFTALSYAPAAQVNVLNYMWPIFILMFSIIILKDKFSWKTLIAFSLGIIGATIVITKGQLTGIESEYILGYILACGAGLLWALFSVLNKTKKLDDLSTIFLYNFIGLIFMFILMTITKSSFVIGQTEVVGTIYIGLFPTAIGFLTWIKAIKEGTPTIIANLGHLTPFVSLLFIYLILGDKILLSEIIGLLVIISGVLLQLKK